MSAEAIAIVGVGVALLAARFEGALSGPWRPTNGGAWRRGEQAAGGGRLERR